LYMQELEFLWSWANVDNAHEIIQTLIKLKPTAAKGYTKGIHPQALWVLLHWTQKQYNW
jgi:hypothetical protein